MSPNNMVVGALVCALLEIPSFQLQTPLMATIEISKKPKEGQITNNTLETLEEKDSKETKPSTSTSTATTTTAEVDSSSTNDMQKRIQRAERFGMPVKLSEEEKRNSRAERFGTAPIPHGSDELKTSEEQKRKERAERFGLPVQSVTDEEAKKKARLARFTPASKTSPVEEEKRKARAARFSQTPSGTSSQIKAKTNSEKDIGDVGEASVGA